MNSATPLMQPFPERPAATVRRAPASPLAPQARHVWFDGRIVPRKEARVDVLAHGLHYGTGVFEGIRAYATPKGPAVFRLEDHLRRLEASAAWLSMRLPYSREALLQACLDVLRCEGLAAAYVRPIAFYGAGGMGFRLADNPVHVAVAAWAWDPLLGREALERGIRLRTVPWRKTPANAFPSGAKLCGAYVNSTLAFQEALRAGADEALLLNERGRVAEGSGENVFAVLDGALFTPPASDDNLPGVTRDTVVRLARGLGLEVRERSFTPAELLDADEVFLTGTAAEVTPVREVDGCVVGDGGRGPVTARLQAAYFRAVEGLDEDRGWLTFVREAPSAMDGGI